MKTSRFRIRFGLILTFAAIGCWLAFPAKAEFFKLLTGVPFPFSDGRLDASFDADGKVITAIGNGSDVAQAMAIQADGKIIAAGYSHNGSNVDFAAVRYNPDGSLDTTFGGGDGKITTAVGSGHDVVRAMLIQPNGKIILAGHAVIGANDDFVLARYNSDGSLDTSFGAAGIVTTAVGNFSDLALAVALQPDGKILAAGYSSNGANADFAVVRYNADGTLDSLFADNGKAVEPIGNSDDVVRAIAVQADGKIVIAGYEFINSNSDIAVTRLNADGTLDTSFDADGKLTLAIGLLNDEAFAVAIQPEDQKIVISGYTYINTNGEIAVVRFNPNGTLDQTFDNDGIVITGVDWDDDWANALALQSDGKIVVAGYADGVSSEEFAVVRYNSDGSLDDSFDADGKLITQIGSSTDIARAVVIQPDGKIVAVGYSYNGSNNDFALARYGYGTNGTGYFNLQSNVTIRFENAVQAGLTEAVSIAPETAGQLPANYELISQSIAFDITSTAQFTDGVNVCINVANVPNAADFARYALLHSENGILINRTVSRDVVNNIICARTTSLSPFVVARSNAVTAATVTVGGRVATANGRGIKNVFVTMTNANGIQRTTVTGALGYYRFAEVPAGEIYIFSATAKRFNFNQPTQARNIFEETGDINFTAE